jgi:ferric-dicitrate binding protein FerR (iron transport regulator)
MNPEDDSPDDVASLIRLAGRRPAVPEDVAARVRAAAHEQWRSGLRRRARARSLWTAGALAAAASIVLAIAWSVLRGGSPVQVESLAGPVSVGSREIETGEGGRVALRLASGHSVRLDGSSKIRILGRAALALDRGAIYVDSGARASEPLRLETPLGEVRETGTQYEVRLAADSLRIRVREGSVTLEAEDGHHTVGALTELEIDRRGSVTTRAIPRSVEGLTARAFLDRIARGGGWTLEFESEEAARIAAETRIQGDVSGMTPEEALEAVLPTCGLTHRIEDGRLIVDRAAL